MPSCFREGYRNFTVAQGIEKKGEEMKKHREKVMTYHVFREWGGKYIVKRAKSKDYWVLEGITSACAFARMLMQFDPSAALGWKGELVLHGKKIYSTQHIEPTLPVPENIIKMLYLRSDKLEKIERAERAEREKVEGPEQTL